MIPATEKRRREPAATYRPGAERRGHFMDNSALFTFLLIAAGIVGLFVLITVVKTMYTVRTYTAGIVERFGKYNRIARPGLQFLVPWCETVRFIDLQVRQAAVNVETKSKDNVFVTIPVSVQYQVVEEKVFDAYYKLSNPQAQIESYVFNSILGHVPTLTLDEAFEQMQQISLAVKRDLDEVMDTFGYNILRALVTDIVPDAKVKAAMNDINAAQREQIAAQARGEADKILKVKQAEAEAESKALQGDGVARQRQAIIKGLQSSVESFKGAVEGSTAQDVMAMVLMTQYFDTLREVGVSGKSATIMLPSSPGTVNDLMTQILAGFQAVKPQ
jgi:regulator of protease activity HflC (stomatin/prohibitin superfamily)